MEATSIYKVIAKRHDGSSRPDVVLFYDVDKKESIKYMQRYVNTNGFTYHDTDGRFTIANVLLREEKGTETISEIPYIDIFDGCGNRRETK